MKLIDSMTSKYFRKKWRSILVYGWVIYIHKQKNLRLFSLISPGRPIFPKYRKITWANCWVSCCCKFPTVRIKAFQCKHDKSTLLFLMATYFFPNTLSGSDVTNIFRVNYCIFLVGRYLSKNDGN